MSFTLPSFAKINLYLRVLGRRDDGFHEIFTIFHSVSLHDDLHFEENGDLLLLSDHPELASDGSNLVIRAARSLQEMCGITKGASIRLTKRIPIGGGLGGGSSNAATTLIGLMRLWNIEPDPKKLNELAAGLGSDVPFFLHGGSMLGLGRGTELEDIDVDIRGPLLIVTPDIKVSSAGAYAALRAENLTKTDVNRILRVCRSEAAMAGKFPDGLRNDFETAVFSAYPEIERVKQALLENGADAALLSGSGASVFGFFDKEETRQAAMKALDNEVNWRKFAVAAVSREQYREDLGI